MLTGRQKSAPSHFLNVLGFKKLGVLTKPKIVVLNKRLLGMISCFRREVAENWALLRYYAASIVNFSPTFRDNLSGPICAVLGYYTASSGNF